MKKRLIVIGLFSALALTVAGCAGEAQKVEGTSNSQYDVELLFEHEGVKVYRFYDGANPRYYTDAAGVTSWREQRGKYSHEIEVPSARNHRVQER